MTKPVAMVNVADRFSLVESRMREKKIRHLPVVDNEQRVVGLVSQRDLFRIASPRITPEGPIYDPDYLNGFILSNVMTQNIQVLSEFQMLRDAVYLMTEKKIGCVPIIDKEERLSGVVTQGDILRFLSRAFRAAEGRR